MDLKEELSKIRETLKDFMKDDTSPDNVKILSEIGNSLNNVEGEITKISEDNAKLKDKVDTYKETLSDMVIHGGFKPNGHEESVDPEETKPLEMEEIAKNYFSKN